MKIVGIAATSTMDPAKLKGADGSRWFDGTMHLALAPIGLVPDAKSGDYYLNTYNGDVCVAGESMWELVGNIKGPAYTLTDTDKAEIVDAVLSALPTWEGGSY